MLPVVNEWEPGEVRGQSPTLVSREALEGPLLSLSTRTQPGLLPNSIFVSIPRKRKKCVSGLSLGSLSTASSQETRAGERGFQSHGPGGLVSPRRPDAGSGRGVGGAADKLDANIIDI